MTMSTEWVDDERDPVFRFPQSHYKPTTVDGGDIYKQIAVECSGDAYARSLLWNEVEHVNYEFEPLNCPKSPEYSLDELNDFQDTIEELNTDCMDALVKHQTAYT